MDDLLKDYSYNLVGSHIGVEYLADLLPVLSLADILTIVGEEYAAMHSQLSPSTICTINEKLYISLSGLKTLLLRIKTNNENAEIIKELQQDMGHLRKNFLNVSKKKSKNVSNATNLNLEAHIIDFFRRNGIEFTPLLSEQLFHGGSAHKENGSFEFRQQDNKPIIISSSRQLLSLNPKDLALILDSLIIFYTSRKPVSIKNIALVAFEQSLQMIIRDIITIYSRSNTHTYEGNLMAFTSTIVSVIQSDEYKSYFEKAFGKAYIGMLPKVVEHFEKILNFFDDSLKKI